MEQSEWSQFNLTPRDRPDTPDVRVEPNLDLPGPSQVQPIVVQSEDPCEPNWVEPDQVDPLSLPLSVAQPTLNQVSGQPTPPRPSPESCSPSPRLEKSWHKKHNSIEPGVYENFEIVIGQSGFRKLHYQDMTYSVNRITADRTKVYWRCVDRKCNGRVTTQDYRIIGANDHSVVVHSTRTKGSKDDSAGQKKPGLSLTEIRLPRFPDTVARSGGQGEKYLPPALPLGSANPEEPVVQNAPWQNFRISSGGEDQNTGSLSWKSSPPMCNQATNRTFENYNDLLRLAEQTKNNNRGIPVTDESVFPSGVPDDQPEVPPIETQSFLPTSINLRKNSPNSQFPHRIQLSGSERRKPRRWPQDQVTSGFVRDDGDGSTTSRQDDNCSDAQSSHPRRNRE